MERSEFLLNTDENTPKDNLFYNGPAEFLVKVLAEELLKVDQFKSLFDVNIDPYKRMDYQVSALPVMRIYCDRYTKEFESWFINGDIKADVILPAALRRDENQSFQMTITSAIVQQFRRQSFMTTVEARVPGLNELGKRVDVDMTLGFEWQDDIVPLTQITLNFRIDLRIWDDYLTSTNRTKDSPFVETIVDLRRIVDTINGLKDNDDIGAQVGVDQKV